MSDRKNDHSPPEEEAGSLERQKLRFEIRRLQEQSEEFQRDLDKGFLERNVGVVLTTIVSIAAVIVSGLQLFNTYTKSRLELELTEIRDRRSWTIQGATLILANREYLFGEDDTARNQILEMIRQAFPEFAQSELLKMLYDSPQASPELRRALQENRSALVIRSARVDLLAAKLDVGAGEYLTFRLDAQGATPLFACTTAEGTVIADSLHGPPYSWRWPPTDASSAKGSTLTTAVHFIAAKEYKLVVTQHHRGGAVLKTLKDLTVSSDRSSDSFFDLLTVSMQ